MKKHITPYLLIFILILILSGGTFYITQQYNLTQGNDASSASFYQTSAIKNNLAKPVTIEYSYNIQLMHGSCVVIAHDRAGNILPHPYSYHGKLNPSYDCVPYLSSGSPASAGITSERFMPNTKVIWDTTSNTCKEYRWVKPNWVFSKNRFELEMNTCVNGTIPVTTTTTKSSN